MAHVLDAVIQLRDNFSSTIMRVERTIGDFSRTARNLGRDIQNTGRNLQNFGGNLTRSITVPATTAAAAIGGMVVSLGWGRLTALDAAQAQLKGLGFEIEDVERISKQVSNAVQGTVMTMAEGTSVAAGALAAGVREGEELEKYIRLVGAAAVGSNRTVSEMSLIFNRVQGSGKLMTNELNMIEDRMPGFAAAMAKYYGTSLEKFRGMVTAGKVTADAFLTVMEDFAGGMAEAYANSWAGMVANTKSNIGIIGQNILTGVFEQSKDTIAEFLEFLRSDDVRGWAKQTGEQFAVYFGRVIRGIKDAINWFRSLDTDTQKLIGRIVLFAVAAGPAITVLGKMTTGVGKLIFNFGKFAGAVKKVGLVSAIANPGTIVVGVLLALIAAGYLLYKNWDKVKAKVKEVFPNIEQQIATTMGHVKNIIDGLMIVLRPIINDMTIIFQIAWETIQDLFWIGLEVIGTVISSIAQTLSGIVDFIKGVFTGNWELAWQGVVDIFKGIISGIGGILKGVINTVIGLINGFIKGLNKIKIPDWVPSWLGGGKGINIPLIPKLAKGTDYWKGGIAQVHERGGEIIDLPKGSRVYPHDKSVQMAREQGRREGSKVNSINIPKLADTIIVREDADIDKIANTIVRRIEKASLNMG